MTIADDRRAVTDLLLDYAELVDAADLDGVVGLFTADATLDYGFGRTVTGTEALRAFYRDGPFATYRATSHHISNVRVAVDGNRATARCYVYAWHERRDGTQAEAWGRYLDDLVRTADGWRIARRAIRAAGERGFPAPEGLSSAFERPARRG